MSLRLYQALRELGRAGGVLCGVEPYSDALTLANFLPAAAGRDQDKRRVGGWSFVAQALSSVLPGQFWVGARGLAWRCGSQSEWVATPDALEEIVSARRAMRDLMPWKEAPYSISSVARNLLEWTGVRQRNDEAERLRFGQAWHYLRCQPGRIPSAYLWDVESCYYSLLRRMPSPRLKLIHKWKSISWQPLEPGQRSRWKDLMERVSTEKRLRNGLVGIMASSGAAGTCWSKGRRLWGSPTSGALRPAALLIVRTAYELCANSAEEVGARYSNTDCVITESPEPPTPWLQAGLRVRLQARGEAEICNVGSYAINDDITGRIKQTKYYARGSRHPASVVSPRPTGPGWGTWIYEAA